MSADGACGQPFAPSLTMQMVGGAHSCFWPATCGRTGMLQTVESQAPELRGRFSGGDLLSADTGQGKARMRAVEFLRLAGIIPAGEPAPPG